MSRCRLERYAAHDRGLGCAGTVMYARQLFRGPGRRQRIAAISAIHVALLLTALGIQPGTAKIRHRSVAFCARRRVRENERDRLAIQRHMYVRARPFSDEMTNNHGAAERE